MRCVLSGDPRRVLVQYVFDDRAVAEIDFDRRDSLG